MLPQNSTDTFLLLHRVFRGSLPPVLHTRVLWKKKKRERLHFHLYPTTSARLILIIPDDMFIHRSVCLLASGPFVRMLSILVVQRILFVWK